MAGPYYAPSMGLGALKGIEQELMHREEMRRRMVAEQLQRDQLTQQAKQAEAVLKAGEQQRTLASLQWKYQNAPRGAGGLSPEEAAQYREHGMGSLLTETAPTQGEHLGTDESGIDQYNVIPGVVDFGETPAMAQARQTREDKETERLREQQRVQNAMLAPGTPEDARNYMSATGAMAPASMYNQTGGDTPDIGSFEDYVVRRFGNQPTAEQITQARREYGTADDRQPSSDMAEYRRIGVFNRIAGEAERSPLMRAAERTIVLRDAADQINRDPANAASQLQLAYAFIQAVDTYQSAVREGELKNVGAISTRLQQLMVEANRIVSTGAIMPPEVAKQIAANATQLIATIDSGKQQKMREFRSRAQVSGVGDMWDEYTYGFSGQAQGGGGQQQPPPGGASGGGGTLTPYQQYLQRQQGR